MLTDEQNAWLDALVCQRLSADENNDTLRLEFKNDAVESLMDFIGHHDTLTKDASGEIAVYVVKENGKIIAFFSPQCGMIYEKIVSEEDLNIYRLFKEYSDSGGKGVKDERLRMYQALNNMSDSELSRRMMDIETRLHDVAPKKNDEQRSGESDDVTLVRKTVPAIEVVHLCRAEDYEGDFYNLFPGKRLGTVLFMAKAVKIISDVTKLVGCKYVYLFAVTDERDNKLVAHYQDYFGFRPNPGYGVNKGLKASGCLFMAQSVAELMERAKEYFAESEI